MKQQMEDLVRDDWNPDQQALDSFGTDTEQNTARGDYFLESSDKIHYFTEPTALDKDGTSLLPEYQTDSHSKMRALNKVGHVCPDTRCARLLCIGKAHWPLGWRIPPEYVHFQAGTDGGSKAASRLRSSLPRRNSLV
jgi:hypothetical protein